MNIIGIVIVSLGFLVLMILVERWMGRLSRAIEAIENIHRELRNLRITVEAIQRDVHQINAKVTDTRPERKIEPPWFLAKEEEDKK